MQTRFFTVPASDPAELNAFLRSHRVLSIRKELVSGPKEGAFWAIAVDYLESGSRPSGKSSIDYKEVLSEAEFEVFRRTGAARGPPLNRTASRPRRPCGRGEESRCPGAGTERASRGKVPGRRHIVPAATRPP